MDDGKVASIGKKKKTDEHPVIAAFYNQLQQESRETLPLTREQLKVHQAAAGALKIPSAAPPASLSGTIESASLSPHTSHPFGYNMVYEVLDILYAPKQKQLHEREGEIIRKAKEIYGKLDYLIELRQRLKREKTKLETPGGKEPAIESIDFSLPAVQEHLSLTKKERVEKSDLVLNEEFAVVLQHHGYDISALKAKADLASGSRSIGSGSDGVGSAGAGSYVITFDQTVVPKTREDFSSRLKQCAALEELKDQSELLKKEGKGRYDFTKRSKAEIKQLIKELKDLEQVVTTRCEQGPQDANKELTGLQGIQSEQRLIDEAMLAALKAYQEFLRHVLERMGQGR